MTEITRKKHPAFFSAGSLLFITPLCVLGAIIGTQLITTLGVNPNTALIGALGGMALGRIPLAAFLQYRSIHMQNLAQSAISAATRAAERWRGRPPEVALRAPSFNAAFTSSWESRSAGARPNSSPAPAEIAIR